MRILILALFIFLVISFPVAAAEFYHKVEIIADGEWEIYNLFEGNGNKDITTIIGKGKLQINSIKIISNKLIDIKWKNLF